jgi:hypothetical protein
VYRKRLITEIFVDLQQLAKPKRGAVLLATDVFVSSFAPIALKRLTNTYALEKDDNRFSFAMADSSGSSQTGTVVAAQVSFTELCGLLEKLSKTQGNDKKKKVLKDFVDHWRKLHNEVHKDDADTTVSSFVFFFFKEKN